MAFTDDDLKRLKEWICEYQKNPTDLVEFPHNLVALLARFEAAEALLNFGCLCETASSEKEYKELERFEYEWHKAAGK